MNKDVTKDTYLDLLYVFFFSYNSIYTSLLWWNPFEM